MAHLIPRTLLGLVALACVAWFALAIRQSREQATGSALVARAATLSPRQLTHARAALHAAGALNPDRTPTVLRAQLQLARGERAAALETITPVTRAEPENAEAWLVQAQAAHGAAATRAFDRFSALVPPVR